MPKLPENTATKFDSPLRRTSRPPQPPSATSIAEVEHPSIDPIANDSRDSEPHALAATSEPSEQPREAPVIALPRARVEPTASGAEQVQLGKRITVRIDDDIYRALELERLERRLAGDNANIAEVARKALGAWAKRRLARDRT
jgi:hypothetical protein